MFDAFGDALGPNEINRVGGIWLFGSFLRPTSRLFGQLLQPVAAASLPARVLRIGRWTTDQNQEHGSECRKVCRYDDEARLNTVEVSVSQWCWRGRFTRNRGAYEVQMSISTVESGYR